MIDVRGTGWPRAAIPCFLALTILFDAPLSALMIHAGRDDVGHLLAIYAEMWAPGAAAIVTCLLLKKRVAALAFATPPARYAWLGYGIPLLAACVTYPVLWLTTLAPLKFIAFEASARSDLALGGGATVVTFLLVATIGIIRSCSAALGEEIGWRGLLVPALAERMGFAGVTLVSGLIWATWHLPLMLALPGGPPPLSLVLFFMSVTIAAGITAWLRLQSGSIWPAVLFHASHNVFLQTFFDPLTITTGRAGYFATEGGLGMVVAYAIILVILLKVGGVPKTKDDATAPMPEQQTRSSPGPSTST